MLFAIKDELLRRLRMTRFDEYTLDCILNHLDGRDTIDRFREIEECDDSMRETLRFTTGRSAHRLRSLENRCDNTPFIEIDYAPVSFPDVFDMVCHCLHLF